MREFLQELMTDYAREIVFIHILSAILWVGGMITLKLIVAPSIKNIQDINVRLARTLEIMKGFFSIIIIVSLLILITAIIFIIGLDLKNTSSALYQLAKIKEVIWVFMFGIFIYLYIKRNKAQRYFVSGDNKSAKENIILIDKIISINIILGVVAIYLGVMLRGY